MQNSGVLRNQDSPRVPVCRRFLRLALSRPRPRNRLRNQHGNPVTPVIVVADRTARAHTIATAHQLALSILVSNREAAPQKPGRGIPARVKKTAKRADVILCDCPETTERAHKKARHTLFSLQACSGLRLHGAGLDCSLAPEKRRARAMTGRKTAVTRFSAHSNSIEKLAKYHEREQTCLD